MTMDLLLTDLGFEKPMKNPDFILDAVEVCGGSGVLSKAMKDLGLVVSIPLDIERSPHFDLTRI